MKLSFKDYDKDLVIAYKWHIQSTKDRLLCLEVDKRGANEITIGFIEAIQERLSKRLEELQKKLRFLRHKPKDGTISNLDVLRAKQVRITDLIKVPASKKILCLFHTDKSPSMHVYPTSYHCFSCGAHGDVIDFVQKVYGISFIEAVKRLI